MIEQIRDLFARYDPKEYWEERGTRYVKEYKSGTRAFSAPRPLLEKTLVREMKKMKFGSVIEVGCNFGKNLRLISKNFKAKEIAGLDISSTALAEAKKFLSNPKIKLYNSNANKMPFPKNRFDVVIVGEVFEHVPYGQFDPTFREVIRIAKDRIILISPDHARVPLLSRFFHARHVFTYDYVKEIDSRKGIRLLSQHPVDGNQIIYVLEKT